jgi:hypothetical protein
MRNDGSVLHRAGYEAKHAIGTFGARRSLKLEDLCGSIRKGASTPAKSRANDPPKMCPRPRSAAAERGTGATRRSGGPRRQNLRGVDTATDLS